MTELDRSTINEHVKIPGLIDGSLALRQNQQGGVSFWVTVGPPGSPSHDCDQIELVVSAAAAGEISERLRHNAPQGGTEPPMPCSIGMRRHIQ